MNTAGVSTKNAPLLPSSTLLDRRWKEHDYVLHQNKLRAMKGQPNVRFNPKSQPYEHTSPPTKRKVQSAKPLSKSYFNPIAPAHNRPKTSKNITDIYGNGKVRQDGVKRPLFRPVNEPLKEKSVNLGIHRNNFDNNTDYDPDALSAKDKEVLFKNMADQQDLRKGKRRPFTSKDKPPRPFTSKPSAGKRRPFTSKDRNPLMERPPPPMIPQRQRWVKSGGVRPIKSAYSRDVMNDHYKRHQYYKNHILRRLPQKKFHYNTKSYNDANHSDELGDNDKDGSVSSDSDSTSEAISASPSPTPTPPPILELEINLNELEGPDVGTLYFDKSNADMMNEEGEDEYNGNNSIYGGNSSIYGGNNSIYGDLVDINGDPNNIENYTINLPQNEFNDNGSFNEGFDNNNANYGNNEDGSSYPVDPFRVQKNAVNKEGSFDPTQGGIEGSIPGGDSGPNQGGGVGPNQGRGVGNRQGGYGPQPRRGSHARNNGTHPQGNRKPVHSTIFNNKNNNINNTNSFMRPDHLYYKSENFYLRPSNFYPIQSDNENFIPPSHIIKIVKDAEELSNSDWSTDEEPVYVLRDGKPGKYVEKNGKYIRIDHMKSRRKIKREIHSMTEEGLKLKYQKRKSTLTDKAKISPMERESSGRERRVARLTHPNLIGEDGLVIETSVEGITELGVSNSIESVMNAENGEGLTEGTEDNLNDDSKEGMDAMADIEEAGIEGDDEYDENEEDAIDGMEGGEEEEEEEESEEEETVEMDRKSQGFDAKKLYDSDIDEYGRRKSRPRPSSSLYDMLPRLNPDPILDDGDVNKCKIRLLRDTVTIREALENPTRQSLSGALIIIIRNNNDNRRWLRKLYRDEYLQSMLLDLRKNLPADIGSVISYMMIPVCEFDAMCLWDALKGLHKDSEVLSEILCTRNNQELTGIREAYGLRYGDELIDHIEDETLGPFQRILMALAMGLREERTVWEREEAESEAKQVHALMEGAGHHLIKLLIEIFSKRPINMLRQILNEYRKFKGVGMDVDLINVLPKDFARCLITVMLYIQNPPNYYCEKLHNTHFNGRCDDKTLCRILISRSERDMEMIKGLFALRYDMELLDYVEQVCHGSLKGLAMRLIDHQYENKPENQPVLQEEEKVEALVQVTLNEAIKMVLRKTKVVSKCIKLLHIRRERLRQAEAESSDTAEEFELEPEDDNEEDKEQETQYDSAEEEERAAKEAQKELRDGLKNISFADNVQVEDIDPKHKSVFAEVSFAAASRGILKNSDQTGEDEEEEEPEPNIPDLDDELLNKKPAGPKMTQLNGPVLDPTFVSRDSKGGSQFKKLGKVKKFRGTVKGVAMDQFNALKDAQAIGKAMLQKNRNVEGILQFLTTRNNAQRQLIIREFFRRYRRDLVDDLRVLAPHHEEITLSLLLSGEIYDSASLYAAVCANDTEIHKDVFIEILCSRQNDEIAIIKRAFKGIFGMDLEDEIGKFAHGNFEKLLVSIADCKRDEGDFVDEDIANKDSQALYEAIIKKPTNYDVFIEIFGTRSFHHIEAVCDNFAKITRVDLLEILDETLRGDLLEGIIAIICNVRDAPMVFCERIYRSMAYETQYSMLIRCVVSRAEVDLQTIKAAFRRTYGRTLYAMIDKDTDFPSKKILLNVVKK